MIEVLKQALEALEKERPYLGPMPTLTIKAITSLRQAIAELESQEPVAWSCWQSCLNDDGTQTSPWVHRLSKFKPHESIINKDIVPLYTHPPQRKPLTDEIVGLLKEARKIIRASSSRNLVKDWDERTTKAIAAHGIKE